MATTLSERRIVIARADDHDRDNHLSSLLVQGWPSIINTVVVVDVDKKLEDITADELAKTKSTADVDLFSLAGYRSQR